MWDNLSSKAAKTTWKRQFLTPSIYDPCADHSRIELRFLIELLQHHQLRNSIPLQRLRMLIIERVDGVSNDPELCRLIDQFPSDSYVHILARCVYDWDEKAFANTIQQLISQPSHDDSTFDWRFVKDTVLRLVREYRTEVLVDMWEWKRNRNQLIAKAM